MPDGKRCVVHRYRNAFVKAPRTKVASPPDAEGHAHRSDGATGASYPRRMKLSKLGEWIAATVGEILTSHQFPAKH
jgi:hypothetical protein